MTHERSSLSSDFNMKSSENALFSDDFRGNGSSLVHLKSLNIERRYLTLLNIVDDP